MTKNNINTIYGDILNADWVYESYLKSGIWYVAIEWKNNDTSFLECETKEDFIYYKDLIKELIR